MAVEIRLEDVRELGVGIVPMGHKDNALFFLQRFIARELVDERAGIWVALGNIRSS